jgi:hypothetical protein
VVSDLRFLFAPTSRYGADPSERYSQAVFLGSIHPFIYTITLYPHRVSRLESGSTDRPSLLLVAQPDDSLPGVTGEIKVILKQTLKAQVAVTGLVSSEATPSSVLAGLRGSRLSHFACHGALEAGKSI